jgi:hypothetical protein
LNLFISNGNHPLTKYGNMELPYNAFRLLVIDISGSMGYEDVIRNGKKISRLEDIKTAEIKNLS